MIKKKGSIGISRDIKMVFLGEDKSTKFGRLREKEKGERKYKIQKTKDKIQKTKDKSKKGGNDFLFFLRFFFFLTFF